MADTQLALRQGNIIQSFEDANRAATAMAKSGYFSDSREAAQALVKILAGQEMGFGAFSSMTGIHIIQGRPAIGANLMAAAVKGSGRYDYRVTEMSEKNCSVDFYERGEKIGTSTFSIEDARKAQTKNLDKFPRNMLFARAMSNGVRWFCPDVFSGAAVYTPEELGADTDEQGNVITGQFNETRSPESPAASKNGNGNGNGNPQDAKRTPARPFAPEDLKTNFQKVVEFANEKKLTLDQGARNQLSDAFKNMDEEPQRERYLHFLTGYKDIALLNEAEQVALYRLLVPEKKMGGWHACEDARAELVNIIIKLAAEQPEPKRSEQQILSDLGFDEAIEAEVTELPASPLREKLEAEAAKLEGKKANTTHIQQIGAALNHLLGGDEQRHTLLLALTGKDSLKDVPDGLVMALHGWLKPSYDKDAKVMLITNAEAKAEAQAAYQAIAENK